MKERTLELVHYEKGEGVEGVVGEVELNGRGFVDASGRVSE